MQMDGLVDRYTAEMESGRRREARDRKVVQRAQEHLADEYKLDPDTLGRYLRRAAKLMQIPDAGLAIKVNEERERQEREGAANPLNSALALYASKRKLPLWSVRGRYERGKRWVLRNVEDTPDFK
jgi:hypothetical protein